MSMRVLSGILVTRNHSEGTVTIHFRDNSVTGTLDRAQKTKIHGANGRFDGEPCKIVAQREISFVESGDGRTRFPQSYNFEINDKEITEDYMVIEWKARNCRIEEIAYMVIGEVEG